MTINTFWVVTDATADSTLADICWKADDPVQLANIIVGAGGSPVVARERWTFYTDADEANADACDRLVTRATGRQDLLNDYPYTLAESRRDEANAVLISARARTYPVTRNGRTVRVTVPESEA